MRLCELRLAKAVEPSAVLVCCVATWLEAQSSKAGLLQLPLLDLL